MTEQKEFTITISGCQQTGLAHRIYHHPNSTSELYVFDNKFFTFDGWLPHWLLQHLPAAYTLPRRFVIKIKPLDDEDARFWIENEKIAYKHMLCQQGIRIPRVFLDVSVSGFQKSAIAMELLEGQSLLHISHPSNPSRPKLDLEYICRDIHSCFDTITNLRMEHWDVGNLANFMLVQRSPQRGVLVVETACLVAVAFLWQNSIVTCILSASWFVLMLYAWSFSLNPPRVVLLDWEDHKIVRAKDDCARGNKNTATAVCEIFRENYMTPFQKTYI